jgi:hypothetical protein
MDEKEKRFTKVCIKLDELRFKNPISFEGIDNLRIKSAEKIYLLWLCSMIDQFYPYETIWESGKKAMHTLLKANSFDAAKKMMKNIGKDKKGDIVADIPINNEKTFKLVRDDYIRIKNTFDFLSTFEDGDIPSRFVKFLGNCILAFQGKGIHELAYYLNSCLWNNSPVESFSEKEVREFLDMRRKRLWMFIMFLKRNPSTLFRKALMEVYGEKEGEKLFSLWKDDKKFDPKEIELPGDVWNIRLFEYLEISKKNARQKARELASKFNISPSVFDVTFQIGADKCPSGKNPCEEWHNCPFGENKKCHKGNKKFCSVAQWLFGDDNIVCEPKNCPIGNDLGKKMCREWKGKRLSEYI